MNINTEKNIIVIGLLCLFVFKCEGYKILLIFPSPSQSHDVLGNGYIKYLLKAGHELTYISPFPKQNTHSKLRQIGVAENIKAIEGALNVELFMKRKSTLNQETLFNLTNIVFETTLKNSEVQKLLNDPAEHFDVVILDWIFTELYIGFASVFNCPFIWSYPYELNFVGLSLIDEASNPAYTANVQFSNVPPFDFGQRVFALWFQITHQIKYMLFYEDHERSLYESYFRSIVAKRGRTLPPYREFKYNASFMFGFSHVSFGQARRLPQNYISIAGQHIDNVKPLPENLQRIMDNAKNGVIFFSLGSNLKSKQLPNAVKDSLLKLFGELKQTVIWKFEEELLNRPKNVHILKWAPQSSILAHPNCTLFITHGGLLSTTEAVHFGVPFIGIPAFYDQFFNVYQAVKKGIGLSAVLTKNLANDLKEAIHEMIENPKYRQRIKEISFVYHHRPVSPGKEIVHWVEHVVKTGGARHLRSPALLMPWYQKMFLDLFALLLVAVFSIICIIKLFVNPKAVLGGKKKIS